VSYLQALQDEEDRQDAEGYEDPEQRQEEPMKLFRAAMAAIPLAAFSPHPAKAGLLDNLIYGSPGDYARAFAQCAASTVTVHQELQCASNWLTWRNISGLAQPRITAFFEEGRALEEQVNRGQITNLQARAELAEIAASGQAYVSDWLSRHRAHFGSCSSWGYSTNCWWR
jgi:hypothetical protein